MALSCWKTFRRGTLAGILAGGLALGADVPCLHYEPELVRLSGVLEKTDGAWIVRLSEPICTTGPDETNRPERDVREVELLARGTMLARFTELAGKGVSASGTLSHAHGGNHRAVVLLAVKGLVAKALPPWAPQTRSHAAPGGGRPPAINVLVPPTPREIPEHPTEADVDAAVGELTAKLSPSAARELGGLQERWRELAERDCRWEVSLAQEAPAGLDVYSACISRARRDRIRRLRALMGP